MTPRFRPFGCFLALTVLYAAAAQGQQEARRVSRSARVLTRGEIVERASGAGNVLEAVRRLRGSWLRSTGTTSFSTATPVKIYVNNVLRGDVDVLSTIVIDHVEEIRHLRPTDATARWGTGHTGGAIEVILTALAAPRPTRELERVRPEGAEDIVGYQYNPFRRGLVLQVNTGLAKFFRPLEKRSVWQPSVSLGGGVGARITERVTVFGAAEYHRFSFSRSGAIDYLRGQEERQRRLNSTENVEIRGGSNTIMNVSVNVKLDLNRSRSLRPYFIGGIGYARLNTGDFRVSGPGGAELPRPQFSPGAVDGGDQVENTFSVAGGLGLDVRVVGRVSTFADIRYVEAIRGPRYNDVFDENQLFNTEFFPLRLGLMLK